MSSENQTNIRFSLKETVWFQKGQEVKEVRSLSLNPDITIQQFDEYVQVKGVLTLEGNYSPEEANQGDYISLRELAPSRLVEDVVLLEDGSCELRHQFPVDISIPLTRVTDLENLCVSVETFDYQLAEKGSIQIAADLCISGLHDNRAIDTYYEQRAQEQYNTYNYSNDYRSSDVETVNEEENREQEEQFQFFNQQPVEQSTDLDVEKDNLYGSDWIQSLEDEQTEEVQTYPQQPTYLEVFRPAEVEQNEESDFNDDQAYLEEEDNTSYGYNAELSNEQSLEIEFEEQHSENTNDAFIFNAEQPEEQVQEFQGGYRDSITQNELTEQENNENSESTAYPSFNNGFNIQPNILINEANQRPAFLNNDYSALQNLANNPQNETQNYEEQYNRSVEQSYHPYFNNQYQQPPINYNQQQFYQSPYPQNQVNPYANPNDVRQTPPYYAEYYQAQVEQEPVQVEHSNPTTAKEEVNEERGKVRSDNLLSSLFTGEGREESYSKLKLYLAQNGDTVESVAKKYNLQTQQLNRVNNLNDEFLSEGQIIYIPITAIKQ